MVNTEVEKAFGRQKQTDKKLVPKLKRKRKGEKELLPFGKLLKEAGQGRRKKNKEAAK